MPWDSTDKWRDEDKIPSPVEQLKDDWWITSVELERGEGQYHDA